MLEKGSLPDPPSKDLTYNNMMLYEKFWKGEPEGKNKFFPHCGINDIATFGIGNTL